MQNCHANEEESYYCEADGEIATQRGDRQASFAVRDVCERVVAHLDGPEAWKKPDDPSNPIRLTQRLILIGKALSLSTEEVQELARYYYSLHATEGIEDWPEETHLNMEIHHSEFREGVFIRLDDYARLVQLESKLESAETLQMHLVVRGFLEDWLGENAAIGKYALQISVRKLAEVTGRSVSTAHTWLQKFLKDRWLIRLKKSESQKYGSFFSLRELMKEAILEAYLLYGWTIDPQDGDSTEKRGGNSRPVVCIRPRYSD